MTYAAGKIPGGFFKREGRPSEKEVLTSRFIDRPLRPLFPKNYFNDVQIIATVLSADSENNPDTLAIIGASAALTISDIPFFGPIAGVRVGRINGQLVINPSFESIKESDLEIIVAGSEEAVVMVEGGAEYPARRYGAGGHHVRSPQRAGGHRPAKGTAAAGRQEPKFVVPEENIDRTWQRWSSSAPRNGCAPRSRLPPSWSATTRCMWL